MTDKRRHKPRIMSLDVVCEAMLDAGRGFDPRFGAGRVRIEAEMTSYEDTMRRRFFGGARVGPVQRERIRALLGRAHDTELTRDLRGYFNGRRLADVYITAPYVAAATRLIARSGALR